MAELRDQLAATLGDGYTIERELGGGGMSRVFVASDRSLGREIVVKVLPPELGAEVNVERFRREIQFAARLQHPHIVPLLSAGETSGLPYFTMPFVNGESLRSRLTREGELPIAEAVRILRDVAVALAYAHDHGVVHRDIKPENVLLSGGTSTVTDFGVAKALSASAAEQIHTLTGVGTTVGSPRYMAPEQASADPSIDHRADIYALGLLGYEMLSGTAPFAGRSIQATMAAHLMETPPSLASLRPSVPPELSSLIAKCLEKRPADRPQSAAEVVRWLDSIAISSGERTAQRVSAKPIKSGTHTIALVSAVVIALLIIGGLYYRSSVSDANPSRPMVAVLPFENLGVAGDEYFADGISEEITGRLARISGIGVIARGSAAHYKKSSKSLPEIAKELGVNFVLTGTVRWEKSGNVNRVRVSPELVRISDQRSVWSEPYDADFADVFKVQSSIAERVASALDVRLRPQEKSDIAARPTQNLDAYDCYLRGRAAMSREMRFTPAKRVEAVRAMECATMRDPEFALAHASLSEAYTLSYMFGDEVTPERLEKAKAEAERAIKLDPRRADGHVALMNYNVVRGDIAAAKKELSAAISLDSTNAEALIGLARFQLDSADVGGAIETYSRALAIDPRNLDALGELAGAYDYAHRHDIAVATRERELAVAPDNALSYQANAVSHLLWRADTAAARKALQRGVDAVGMKRMLVFVYAVNMIAMTPEMMQTLDTIPATALGGSRLAAYGLKTNFYLFRGNPDRARAYAESTIVVARSRQGTSLSNAVYRLIMANAEAVSGHRNEALAHVDDLMSQARQQRSAIILGRALTVRAAVYGVLGDEEKALDDLERLMALPTLISPASLRVDWRFNSLRSNPRFQRLVARSSA